MFRLSGQQTLPEGPAFQVLQAMFALLPPALIPGKKPEEKKYKQQQNANIRVSFKPRYLPENKFSPLTATGRVAGFLLQLMNVLLSVSYEAKVYETNKVAANVQLPCRCQPRR